MTSRHRGIPHSGGKGIPDHAVCFDVWHPFEWEVFSGKWTRGVLKIQKGNKHTHNLWLWFRRWQKCAVCRYVHKMSALAKPCATWIWNSPVTRLCSSFWRWAILHISDSQKEKIIRGNLKAAVQRWAFIHMHTRQISWNITRNHPGEQSEMLCTSTLDDTHCGISKLLHHQR